MRKFFLLPFFLLLFTLTGCNSLPFPGVVTVAPSGLTRIAVPTLTPLGPASPYPANSTTPEATLPPAGLTGVAVPKPPPTPTVTPAPAADLLPRYVIDASMDYEAKTLDVQQQIDYPNTSGGSLSDIVLAIQPNRIQGVFELKSLSADDAPVTDYTLVGQKLTVKLAAPLENGKTLKLELVYHLALPKVEQGDPNVIRPQIFGVTARQVNLTDWYPMVVPYQPGSGWVLHDPWYYGEHLVYPLANFDVTLRFSDSAWLPAARQNPSMVARISCSITAATSRWQWAASWPPFPLMWRV
jgi:hypothetical protein